MLGSYFGGITTIICLMAGLTYFSLLVTRMESGDYDQIKSTVMTNSMGTSGTKNNLNLIDFHFMPILEVPVVPTSFDVFKGEPKDGVLDLEKL